MLISSWLNGIAQFASAWRIQRPRRRQMRPTFGSFAPRIECCEERIVLSTAPVVTLLPAGPAQYTVNSGTQVIAANSTVTDADTTATFNGGTMTESITANANVNDTLAIQNQGTAAGQIGVSGSNVTFGGATIGTFSGGTGTNPLVITFNANADLTAIQALQRDITFQSTVDPSVTTGPEYANRTFQSVVTDANANASTAATETINVLVAPAPVVTLLPTGPLSYTINSGAQLVAPNSTVTDADASASFAGGTMTESIGANATANDVLSIKNVGRAAGQIGVSGSNVTYGGTTIGTFTGGTGTTPLVVTFNASATLPAVQALQDAITFQTTVDPAVTSGPAFADRTFRSVVTDGSGNASQPATKLIDVLGATGTLTISNSAPHVINSGITLNAAQNQDLTGVTLTVSLTGATARDHLGIQQGSAVSLSGNQILFNGTAIGTFTGGTGTTPLVITFNSSATVAEAQQLAQSITFRSIGHFNHQVAAQFQVSGGITVSPAITTINVVHGHGGDDNGSDENDRFGGNGIVFVIGLDQQVYAQQLDASGNPVGAPSLVAIGQVKALVAGTDANGNPLLFVEGLDSQVFELRFDANGNSLGNFVLVQPGQIKAMALGADASNNPLLFVIGMDDQVYVQKFDASGTPVGGFTLLQAGQVKSISLGSDANANPEVFVIGLDNQVYVLRLNASGTPVGGFSLTAAGQVKSIAVSQDAGNNPLLFVVGLDDEVFEQKFDADGHGIGAFTLTQPGQVKSIAVGRNTHGNPLLFAIGLDDQVASQSFDAFGNSTGAFQLTQPGAVKSIVAGRAEDGTAFIVVIASDDQIGSQAFDDQDKSKGPFSNAHIGASHGLALGHQ